VPTIKIADRAELVQDAIAYTFQQREELRKEPNWNQLYRYLGIIGLTGIATSQENRLKAAHARKMVALEADRIHELVRRPKTAGEFWEYVRGVAGNEMDTVNAFDNPAALPRSYQTAGRDLEIFHSGIREMSDNPLIFALRQSIASIKQRKG
jgi:hypothetical protein